MFQTLNSDWNIPETIAKYRFVILQFGTVTCTPCKAIAKKLESWAENYEDVLVEYIPMETYLEESVQMDVFSSPTVMCYIDGQLTQKVSGYFSLTDFLEKAERQIDIAR